MSPKEKPQSAYNYKELVISLFSLNSVIWHISSAEQINQRIQYVQTHPPGPRRFGAVNLSRRQAVIELLHSGDPVIISAIVIDHPDFIGISEKTIRKGLNFWAKKRIKELEGPIRGTDKEKIKELLQNLENFQKNLLVTVSPTIPGQKK